MIEVRDLAKRFGSIAAVDGVSFRAEDGEVTALLGPNGAGKTTTLRMIYGLIAPDSGAVSVDAIDVGTSPLAAQARLGVLPESRGLYPRLTAREHVKYFARLHGLDRSESEERCRTLIESLEMADIGGRRAQGFSHGERTKVALARALVHGPRNVLLDEPTAGLDVSSTRAIRAFIHRLRNEGNCIVFSTHVMQEVAALCDRIVIVVGGRVGFVGTPDALRSETDRESLEDAFVKLTSASGEPS